MINRFWSCNMRDEITVGNLRALAENFVETESQQSGVGHWWRGPLLATAKIDHRFEQLPKIAASDHWHPYDLLSTARSVVVFFIPFNKELVKENKNGDRPCLNWGLAYIQTNRLIERLSHALNNLFKKHNFTSSLTPATHNFDEIKLMARWSHKHLGHLVDLGRFGMHGMLITPAGCAGRLGSLVTEADLGNHPLIETEEACLLKSGKDCGQCINACPVEALTEKDFDRRRCWNRLEENRSILNGFSELPNSTHVCGKCAALMPCSFKNPVKSSS